MANTGMSNGKMKSACMHYNGAAGAKARAPHRDFNHTGDRRRLNPRRGEADHCYWCDRPRPRG